MGFFNGKKEMDQLVIEREELRKKVRELKDEKMTLESQKKMEIEEIKHLNRLAQEKRDIELEREKLKVQREYNDKVEILTKMAQEESKDQMKTYHASVVETLQKHNTDMREVTTSVYKDIIARLPNVNVTMKR